MTKKKSQKGAKKDPRPRLSPVAKGANAYCVGRGDPSRGRRKRCPSTFPRPA